MRSSTEQRSNSLLTVGGAPLGSSISVASSLNSSAVLATEIEYLKKCLNEIEQQENPVLNDKYQDLHQRLKSLLNKTSSN